MTPISTSKRGGKRYKKGKKDGKNVRRNLARARLSNENEIEGCMCSNEEKKKKNY
jgi:hypothetical protein